MDNLKWYEIDIRSLVYKVVLPIYLWSIRQKDLDSYIDEILICEEALGNIKIINKSKLKQ